MNDTAKDPQLPAALRMQLRALRTPGTPARELWPEIAARLAAQPQPAARAPRRLRAPRALAVAAVLALALGLGWQLRPSGPDAPSPTPSAAPSASTAAPAVPLLAVADAMAREYEGALREIPAPRPASPGYRGLLELDANAAAVRSALSEDPDAVFLLQRLQRIHARRLALTRQLASV